MLTRRIFNNCILCAGMGLIAMDANAQATPGLERKILSKSEMPNVAYDVLQVLVTIEPNFLVARHTHPGTESSAVLEGGGVLSVKGAADRTLVAGDTLFVPPEIPHALQNKRAVTRLAVTYTVERGKPLATPAPE